MQKIKKHHYGFISGQNGTRHTGNDENDMGQDENDTKKMLWFRSIPTRPRIGNFREIVKKFKKLKKHHYGLFSSQNVMGQAENERKKSYRSDPFQPNPELGILKKEQKISKN